MPQITHLAEPGDRLREISHVPKISPCESSIFFFLCFSTMTWIKSGWWYTYTPEKYESRLGWWNSPYIGMIKPPIRSLSAFPEVLSWCPKPKYPLPRCSMVLECLPTFTPMFIAQVLAGQFPSTMVRIWISIYDICISHHYITIINTYYIPVYSVTINDHHYCIFSHGISLSLSSPLLCHYIILHYY